MEEPESAEAQVRSRFAGVMVTLSVTIVVWVSTWVVLGHRASPLIHGAAPDRKLVVECGIATVVASAMAVVWQRGVRSAEARATNRARRRSSRLATAMATLSVALVVWVSTWLVLELASRLIPGGALLGELADAVRRVARERAELEYRFEACWTRPGERAAREIAREDLDLLVAALCRLRAAAPDRGTALHIDRLLRDVSAEHVCRTVVDREEVTVEVDS